MLGKRRNPKLLLKQEWECKHRARADKNGDGMVAYVGGGGGGGGGG